MATPRRPKTAGSRPFTVIAIHRRPPDADARLARAARTCLAVFAEANTPPEPLQELPAPEKKAG